MKLTKIEIEGFRSVRECQTLHIDPSVTVLIGANDHGKTNLLEAIRCINGDRPFTEKDKNWDTDDPSNVKTTFYFTLDPEEIKEIQELAVAEIKKQPADSTKPPAETTKDGIDVPAPSELEKCILVRSGLAGKFVWLRPGNSILDYKPVLDYMNNHLPRIELFEPVASNIKDSISLAELIKPENEFMQGIFRKAGIWEHKDVIFSQTPRTEKLLSEASQKLTNLIQAEWEQGKELNFVLNHTAGGIALRIQDPAVSNTYVLPSQRSSGFTAFFVLHFRLFARQEANPSNRYIFLFDEPGTYLHPKGQVNLVRVFETLSRKNQVVYATHSIFMVNKNEPTRHRVILKTVNGTVVDQKPYLNNWKSVRSSLGLFFSNNFFFADATLLVEGPSDVLYVLSILKTLGHFSKIDIDLNLFSIRDGGNQTDYCAMAKLMADEGRKVVALVDGDESGAILKDELEKLNPYLEGENKIAVIPLQKTKSIEDYVLFEDLLIEAVVLSCEELAREKIRTYQRGIDRDSIFKKTEQAIKNRDGTKTLGKLLEELTAGFFDPKKKISKLQIARNYEDLAERRVAETKTIPKVSSLAMELANNIKEQLNLKSREAQKRVF